MNKGWRDRGEVAPQVEEERKSHVREDGVSTGENE